MLISCGTTQRLTAKNPDAPSDTWYLQVTLVPGCHGLDQTIDASLNTPFPWDLKEFAFAGSDKARQLILCYRVYGKTQLELVRQQLLATGLVENMKVTSNNQPMP